MTIALSAVSARGVAERGLPRPILTNVDLEHREGVLAILGAAKDGTSLLFEVIDGSLTPRSGRVTVLGRKPGEIRSQIARVSLDAPLPDPLRVDELCDLAADVRAEPRRPASERLELLGIGALARRRVRSLSLEERRAVSIAIALTSKARVILIEEPLAHLDPAATRFVVDAIAARAAEACIVVTTASARDATRISDRLGLLTAGTYTPLPPDLAHVEQGIEGGVSVRLVAAPTSGDRAASLLAALDREEAITRVETAVRVAPAGSVTVLVSGRELTSVAKAITRAIAVAKVDVELIEPGVLALEAIRAGFAARALSPPPGSLPPGSGSTPPASAVLEAGSLPPPSGGAT